MALLAGNSLWYLIKQSDAVSGTVLIILLGMSILCWAVFLCKAILVRLKKRDLRIVLNKFKNVRTADDILALASEHAGTVPGYFLSNNLMFLKSLLESHKKEGEHAHHAWELMQHHIDQTLDTLVAHQEAYLPILSTSAAVATLLGLFGTVWGLVQAFVSIGAQQSVDITVIAPGIAQALITTLAGLMVAIPAFVMYNYLVVQVRNIENQLIQLADKLSFVMQQLLTR